MLAEQKENNVATSKSLTTRLNKKRLVLIGHIKKAHGLKGEVFIYFYSGEALEPFPHEIYLSSKIPTETSRNLLTDFDQFKGDQMRVISQRGGGQILSLDSCSNRDQAESLEQRRVYISTEYFQTQNDSRLFLYEVKDFNVYASRGDNKTITEIGRVDHFVSHKYQDLLVVHTADDQQIEIPFVEDFVQSIDNKEKKIIMNLPEGFPGIDL